jgi:hypothetical protein
MFRKLRSLSRITRGSKDASYEKVDEEPERLHPNSDESTTLRHGNQQASNVESAASLTSTYEPSTRISLESIEAPLLAEEEKEHDGTTTESTATTVEEEKKPAFSGAEYKIAFSHFIVSFQLNFRDSTDMVISGSTLIRRGVIV